MMQVYMFNLKLSCHLSYCSVTVQWQVMHVLTIHNIMHPFVSTISSHCGYILHKKEVVCITFI